MFGLSSGLECCDSKFKSPTLQSRISADVCPYIGDLGDSRNLEIAYFIAL